MTIKNFSKNGYVILRNCISNKLIKLIQKKILLSLLKDKLSSFKNFEKLCDSLNNKNLFKYINPINKTLFNENFIEKILTEKKLHNNIVNLLGSDLAVSGDSSLTINIPNNLKNYYYKDWHQEIWSGASVSNIQIWMPMLQKNKNDGQITFIKDSHKWGHVPHTNRKPIKLPENYKSIKTNLNLGDVVIFSTTLMHKTLPATSPRVALAMTIKNFKYNDYSYADNFNWKIYSYSEITKMQRHLGNHYLSPYRIYDKKINIDLS